MLYVTAYLFFISMLVLFMIAYDIKRVEENRQMFEDDWFDESQPIISDELYKQVYDNEPSK